MRPEDQSSTSCGRRCDGGTRAEPIKRRATYVSGDVRASTTGLDRDGEDGSDVFAATTDPNGWPEAGSGRITVGEWSHVGGEQHN